MIAAEPTTATATGFLPTRMAGSMNLTRTAKETASPARAKMPRHRPNTTTTAAQKMARARSGPRRWKSEKYQPEAAASPALPVPARPTTILSPVWRTGLSAPWPTSTSTILPVSGPAPPVSLTPASWHSAVLSLGIVSVPPPQGRRSSLTTVPLASLAGPPMKSGVGGLASEGQSTTRPSTVAAASGSTSTTSRNRARAWTRAAFSLDPPWECPMGALSSPPKRDRGTLGSVVAGGDRFGDVAGPGGGGGFAVAAGGDGRLQLLGDALVVGVELGRLGVGVGDDAEVDEGLLDRLAPQADALDRGDD